MPVPNFREIRIENTNACGYKCVMCPREKQTRQLGYMTIEDFSLIWERIGPFRGSVHLHGFGEPLLDCLLIEKIHLLKSKNPASSALIFSTLGVKVKEGFFARMAAAGLDSLIVSFYGFTKLSYQKVHGVDRLEQVKKNLLTLSQESKGHSLKVILKLPDGPINNVVCGVGGETHPYSTLTVDLVMGKKTSTHMTSSFRETLSLQSALPRSRSLSHF